MHSFYMLEFFCVQVANNIFDILIGSLAEV